MDSMYQILQWTPFPNVFQPMPEYQLQMAEFDLRLNKAHYYEHAVKVDGGFLYPLEIAESIVAYWQNRYSFAEFQLQKHAQQSMHLTAFNVGTQSSNPLQASLFAEVSPAISSGR